MPEPEDLPRPLLEEDDEENPDDREKPEPCETPLWYVILKFPSESYFLGLPLFFFPNKSRLPWPPPPPVFPGVTMVVASGPVNTDPSVFSTFMLIIWGTEALIGCGDGLESVFPGDPETVLSFSSMEEVEEDEGGSVCGEAVK